MLRIEEARPKSYEERIAEVVTEIPLFSREWTNFNPSDPGITMLENLTAFAALQAEKISDVPYDAKRRLFALAGFKPGKGKCARVLMMANGVKTPITLPTNTRFTLGGMVFETNRPVELTQKLTAVYANRGDDWRNMSFLLDREIPVGAEVFGSDPAVDDALYLFADHLPEAGREIIFFMTLDGDNGRNPVEDRSDNVFASIRWECYTENGFVEMKTRDYTGCFLVNGEIRLRMPDEAAAVFSDAPEKGYCIRAVLEKASYDIPPRLFAIDGFLFEAWQRDTLAACIIINKTDRMTIRHPLAASEHVLVFAKEKRGSTYRRYMLSYTGDEPGRYVKYTPGEPDENGRQKSFTIEFGTSDQSMKPAQRVKDPVRLVLFSEEVMRQYAIGTVLGYDDQELDLPMKHIVTDSFCLIARRTDEDGEYIYDFVRPEKNDEDALYYHLLENDGKIIIEEAGAYIGAELFVGSIAVTEGEKGNVREMGKFVPETKIPGITFYNPGAGTGGAFRETLAQMGVRLRRDIDTPYTAVTAADYEKLVRETPGLCIKKVHAVIDEVENLVRIAVLPATNEEFPKLSAIYRKAILANLDSRRLVATRIEILSPRYVKIHVRGTVYVKRQYTDPAKLINETIVGLLDDIHSDRGFGVPLYFRDIFSALEALPCVAFVYELSIMPDDRQLARVKDSDVIPNADTLCIAGEIAVDVVTYDK